MAAVDPAASPADAVASDAKRVKTPPSDAALDDSARGSKEPAAEAEPEGETVGLLDQNAFAEAMRMVDVMETAGGVAGFQAQVTRVDDMVLGMVEQDLADECGDDGSLEVGSIASDENGSLAGESLPSAMPSGVFTDADGRPSAASGTVSVEVPASQEDQTPKVQRQDSLDSDSNQWECWSRLRNSSERCANRLMWETLFLVGLMVPFVLFFIGQRRHDLPIYELLIPLAIALAGARIVVALFYLLVEAINVTCVTLPSRILLLLAALAGWPVTCLVWFVGFRALPAMPDYVASRWAAVEKHDNFWSLTVWMGTCSVTKVLLEFTLQVVLNGLTVKHYEARVLSAVAVYASIRRLFAVARAAEKANVKFHKSSRAARHKAVEAAASEAAAKADSKDLGGSGPSAFERLQGSLGVLAGPLQFGHGFRDAASVDDARKIARRAFGSLAKAQHVSREEGLSRKGLLKWLDRSEKSIEASVFMVDPVREEDFVAVVERAYKEQRFITASLSSFDVCNSILRRFFIVMWVIGMILVLAFAFGIDFQEWVLPMITLCVSICWVLSRVIGDLMVGGIFVLWIRPFDIGDWVKLSSPGQPPKYDEMMVRSIGLWRTQFVSSTGELLLIQNSQMNGMCISNLNRSSDPVTPMKIQVPACTAPAKVTELVDSIRQFVQDRDTEWQSVSLTVTSIDYNAGHMDLVVWPTARCLHHEFGALYGSKTRLLLFIHAYMQAAGIEYVAPLQPVKLLQ